MQCEMPTTNTTTQEIKEIFAQTKTIAIIGLSPNETKDSNKVGKYLLDNGFRVFPVYPKEDTILGQKVYRSLSEIDEPIDMVDIFRKSEVIAKVVDEVIKKGGIKCVWTQLGLVNNQAAQKARDAGLKVVQNKCTKIEHSKL